MSDNKRLRSKSSNRSDWNHAMQVMSRLAEARDNAVHAVGQRGHEELILQSENGRRVGAPSVSNSAILIDPDQLARDIAEIEQASAALRKSEPRLEVRRPQPATTGKPRKLRSVWLLIGGIWISTVGVLGSAIGAILYLFG